MVTKSVRLEKLKIGLKTYISEELLDAGVEMEQTYIGHITALIHGYVWGESVGEPKIIRYPRDWWQAVKMRWFPRWALRRWPAIETVHHIDAKVFYPNFRVSLPKEKNWMSVQVLQNEEPVWQRQPLLTQDE